MRLAGSIPKHIIAQYKVQKDEEVQALKEQFENELLVLKDKLYDLDKKYFGLFDKELDKSNEPYWLKQPEIAQIVADSIDFFENEDKNLINYAYCIMPNHLHWVLKLNDDAPVLYKLLQRMKSHTARKANKMLHLEGQFWEDESYDHIVRNEKEFDNIIWYTLQNPVKAGFVKEWKDWAFSFLHNDL